MTKPLNPANLALLQWKLGRPMTPGMKITFTLENLCLILDACRTDEQAAILERQLDALLDTVKAENAMAEAVGQPKH